MEINKNDFDTWKVDPVTKEIFKMLGERMSKIAFNLADGGALIELEAKIMVGRYREIKDLITLEYEDLKEE